MRYFRVLTPYNRSNPSLCSSGAGSRVIERGQFFADRDHYLYYGFEDVMFHWDRRIRTIRMKFIGDAYDSEVPHDHRLFNEAVLDGREISKADYEAGVLEEP